MLQVRSKGKYWYVRGTVREGTQKREVAEQRTRCCDESSARAFANTLERKIQAELRLGIEPKEEGPAPPTFGEAVVRYIANVKPKKGDLWRVQKLLLTFEHTPLPDIDAAQWGEFCREHLTGRDANTLARYQTTMRDVFTRAGDGIPFPANIKHGAKKAIRVRWLPLDVADKLIDAYAYVDPEDARRSAQSPHAQAIAVTLRFQGVRTQECLQIQRPHIDLHRDRFGAVFIPESKNGLSRWIPLHEKTRAAWEPLLRAPALSFICPERGALSPLFLTDKRKPYRDSRIHNDGGNPIARAHRSACKRAKVTDFTPHDWRHHWATWCVATGMDLPTLQALGGWKDLSMVQRYAAPMMDRAGEQLRKLQ